MLSKYLLLTFLLLACKPFKQNLALDPFLYQKWYHSYEDDTNGLKVYRPSTYDFPPSRGRTGFEITEDGDFIQHRIGPTDIPLEILGTWKAANESDLEIEFPNNSNKAFRIQILSVTKDLLTTRQ